MKWISRAYSLLLDSISPSLLEPFCSFLASWIFLWPFLQYNLLWHGCGESSSTNAGAHYQCFNFLRIIGAVVTTSANRYEHVKWFARSSMLDSISSSLLEPHAVFWSIQCLLSLFGHIISNFGAATARIHKCRFSLAMLWFHFSRIFGHILLCDKHAND